MFFHLNVFEQHRISLRFHTIMEKIYYCILVLLNLLLFSCTDKRPVINELYIEGQEIKVDSANNHIGPKVLYGDILYAWNMDYYGGKLTKEEWQKSERLLVSGNGHNEFGYMILSRNQDGTLFVLNRSWVGSKYLSLVKIPHADSITAIKDETKWERYSLKQTPILGPNGKNFVVLSDSSILVTGAPYYNISHVFSIIDFKNQKVTPLDYWPDNDSEPDSIKENRRYTDNSILLDNGKGRFLYQNGWWRFSFIFTIDGTKTNIISWLYSDTFSKENASRVLACCANDNRIYMLLRDSNSKGDKLDKFEDPFIFGNTIEVFDWDGVKQQIIHLDKYGQNLMLSEDSKILYLVSDYSEDKPEPFIFAYELSSLK